MTVGAPRRARRALDDLGLPVDVSALEDRRGDRARLADVDRAAAFAAFEALPPESNLLYTPYIDLRAADLGSVRLVDAPIELGDATLPDDADGLIEIDEGERIGIVLSPEAAAAGVRLTTGVGPDDEALFTGTALPANDRVRPADPGALVARRHRRRAGGRDPRPADRRALGTRCRGPGPD